MVSSSLANGIKTDFDRDGFVVLRNFLDPSALAELKERLAVYIRDVVPHIPSADKFFEDKSNTGTLKQMQRMEQHEPYFKQLSTTGRFPEVARLLLEDDIVPKGVEYFNKPPKVGRPTPAHQDGYYFMLDPCEAVTMWLALEPVDAENGCLRYLRGSHRRGLRPHARTQTLGFSQGISDYGSDEDRAYEVPCEAQPGDLLVHHAVTIHRADGNESSTRSRQALGLVYFAARAREDRTRLAEYQQQLNNELSQAGKI